MIEKIVEIFEENSNKIAYIINDKKITYKELLDRSLFVSKLLKKQGKEPVIIYGHKSIDMLVSIIACLLAKRTYIPVDTYTPISRIKKIIDMTQSTLIIKNEYIDNLFEIETLTLNDLIKYDKYNEICITCY